MVSSARPSASIIAVSISAIAGSFLVAAFSVLMFFEMSRAGLPVPGPSVPPFTKIVLDVVLIFFLAAAMLVFVSGVAALLLRPWARIFLMIAAGVMLFFGLSGVVVALSAVAWLNMPGPPGTKLIVAGLLVVIYGVPVAVALWWLIVFTRRSVVAQFESKRAIASQETKFRIKKPGCPTPIAVVAWFSICSVLNFVVLPFLPFDVPVILFGHSFRGLTAGIILLCLSVLMVASGVGLLRLQRWSFPAALGLQLFYVANLLVTTLNPEYPRQMQAILAEMHLPAVPPGFPDPSQFMPYARYFSLAGLLIPFAWSVCLLYSREVFFAAARAEPANSA